MFTTIKPTVEVLTALKLWYAASWLFEPI
jgi:hypothetical protein